MSQQTLQGIMMPKLWWDDGTWGVIEVKDLPPGCPRSKTNTAWADAAKSNSWDPNLTHAPGPASKNSFVKVRLDDLKRLATVPKVPGPSGKGPAIAEAPEVRYPHKCPTCGGRMLVLFSTIEHEGGSCPGRAKVPKVRW